MTQDEWCAMWDEFSKNPSAPQEWQTHYMNFMFDLVDTSGEYLDVVSSEFKFVSSRRMSILSNVFKYILRLIYRDLTVQIYFKYVHTQWLCKYNV